ncbi:hypothetical protein BGZ61DRAFT_421747 [Ilyonectria robusta]|uniref:uncharacterized protein n=1 Tax=Ilyonectria robusta TaxID=1079257 RepID=UPI001E8E798F|nr:uncharacterized protein BGZ61DRAFT_421747 [Ilyonectria robusta]KAH8688501.1 hypothetical protein BGZ61DRAFT_421747 [Ilyonectria robusta]
MVNYGQPSRDCLPCRKRKLRCDLLVEGCGQCRRARIKCHGYRDRQSLLFRDETRSTQQKVLARQAAAQAVTQSSAPQGMEFGWDVRARYLFVSTYVLGFSHSLGSVAPLCNKASAASHLSASLEATSLAFMANQLHAPDLMQLANASYYKAIQKLGQALAGLSASGVEEALQSVLLLDQYEKIVHRSPQSSSSWMSHIYGGLSLIAPYTQERHLSPTRCQLEARLITSLTVSSAAIAVRVPAAVEDLYCHLNSHLSGVKWEFLGILFQVVNLQADIHSGGDNNLVQRATQLDKLLLNLELKMPSSWRPHQISPAKPHPLIFGTHYEIFADHFITQVNNGIRVARLIVNNIVIKHTPFDRYEASSCSKILATVMDLTQQICATVPQFLLPETNSGHTIPFSSRQSLQCYVLLAPLYMAYQTSNDILMRDWIIQCLTYMAETGRMKVAQDVADLIKSDQNLDYWLVYAMVGSYALAA